MKSLLFKNAWNIKRIKKVSFSEALTMAWKAFKNGIEIQVSANFRGVLGVAFFKQASATAKYWRNTIEDLLTDLSKHKDYKNEGAKFDYGNGVYNGD